MQGEGSALRWRVRLAVGGGGAFILLLLIALAGLMGNATAAGTAGAGSRARETSQEVRRWVQTDWRGGPGQAAWDEGDPTAYAAGDGVDPAAAGRLGLGYTLPAQRGFVG